VERMPARVDSYLRGDQYMVANGHFGAVEDHQVVVGIEIFPDLNIVPLVALEQRFNMDLLPTFSQ
jgi:hypothetical protein